MGLKNAIREAVDERAKQENSPLENEAEVEAQTPASPTALAPSVEAPSPSDTASHKAVNTASSKKPKVSDSLPPLAPIKTKAVETIQENSESEATEHPGAENPETAALTIRVPRQHRIHWLISAKKEGTSLTAAIAQALNARFGEPAE